MHFVGARFANLQMASSALGELRANVAVAPGDLAVRPLGSTRYDVPSDDIVVAGRFEPDDVDAVIGILEACGGAILARQPEGRALQEIAQPSAPGADATGDRTRLKPATPRKRLRRRTTLLRGRTARDGRIRSGRSADHLDQ